MKIVWSDRSIDRLHAIHDYIAEESCHGAASVIQQIFDSVEQVRMCPKSGRIVPEYAEMEVREILSKPY
jgi:toxin ParE1/3/4